MTLGVETFTAITYGLLALVSFLYLLLVKAFFTQEDDALEEDNRG